jgi:phospholipid/cholesterol/gamma-HCH transport system substrate-binding protein
MPPAEADRAETEGQKGSRSATVVGRVAALVALVVAAIAVVILLMGDGDAYEVTAEFENASQLVEGNQVVIAGTPAGSVKSIELGDEGEALVTFTVEDEFAPLKRGTTATVRSYSLSGVANRQVQLTLPAEGGGASTYPGGTRAAGEEIPDGGQMSQGETVSEVDIDELFNTLDDRTVRNLKKVIKGFEISYEGVGEQANKGFRYLNPFLSTSRRFFGELNRDQRALERLIVDGSQLAGAVSERAPDLEQLIGNLNRFQGALARQKTSLADAVAKFPNFMRTANTTFVNLRATLDDVDPLVDASKPVAIRLRPFFREFRGAARGAVPTIRDLDALVKRPGHANDLVDLNRLQPAVTRAALGTGSPECAENPRDTEDLQAPADDDYTQGAFGEQICALRDGLPPLSFLRAYTPELGGWLDDFSHSGTIDANGGIGRIATTFNAFTIPSTPAGSAIPNLLPNVLAPALSANQAFNGITQDQRSKCPGANERNPGDNSTPFTENGELDCDPTEVPPGP